MPTFDGTFAQLASALEEMPSSNGWRAELPVGFSNVYDYQGYPVAGVGTDPVLALYLSEMTIQLGAGDVKPLVVRFHVPRDYDDGNKDRELTLQFEAYMSGTTNSPTFTATGTVRSPEGALRTLTIDSTFSLGGTSSTTCQLALSDAVDSDGGRIRAGDAITLVITPSAHVQDTIIFTDVYGQYTRNPNFTEIRARHSDDGTEQLSLD